MTAPRCSIATLGATEALDEAAYRDVRRRTIFEGFKWDPQVGDVEALARFALVLDAAEWRRLSRIAERLYNETLAMEQALLRRPDLQRRLSLPRSIARSLASRPAGAERAVRMMRFDFHPTRAGWRLSEVNSDVPGGLIEAGFFSRVMAEHYPDLSPPPDPAAVLADDFQRGLGSEPGGTVAMVHATAYADDRQVMEYIARELRARGLATRMAAPDHVRFRGGGAVYTAGPSEEPLAGIVRFFPAEWLANLPRSARWRDYFAPHGAVLQCNPAMALLSQSKRLPLVWSELGVDCSCWRALLPETVAPGDRAFRSDGGRGWVLKPVWGRVGGDIAIRGVTREPRWRSAALWSRVFPGDWVAQRRFRAAPLATPAGPMYPCLGIYVIDGVAAGIYGRLARRPLVDDRACDVAVLLREDAPAIPPPSSPNRSMKKELA